MKFLVLFLFVSLAMSQDSSFVKVADGNNEIFYFITDEDAFHDYIDSQFDTTRSNFSMYIMNQGEIQNDISFDSSTMKKIRGNYEMQVFIIDNNYNQEMNKVKKYKFPKFKKGKEK